MEVPKEKLFGGLGFQKLRRSQSKFKLTQLYNYCEISKNGIPNSPKSDFKTIKWITKSIKMKKNGSQNAPRGYPEDLGEASREKNRRQSETLMHFFGKITDWERFG